MSMHSVITFLRDLDGHNDKAWMDEHRGRYEAQRDWFLTWIAETNDRLKAVPGYVDTPAKDAIERINNNLLYHPEKPTYKSHFGASFDSARDKPAFYVKVGLRHSMLAGGYRRLNGDRLGAIRRAIDERGDELVAITEEARFRKTFGGLSDRDALSTAPRGYDVDHPHIALLRLKRFTVRKSLTQAEFTADGFQEEVVEAYRIMKPLNDWLAGAGRPR